MKAITIHVYDGEHDDVRWVVSDYPDLGVIDVTQDERIEGMWSSTPLDAMPYAVALEVSESIEIINGIRRGTI
jgi:hypothetical protein